VNLAKCVEWKDPVPTVIRGFYQFTKLLYANGNLYENMINKQFKNVLAALPQFLYSKSCAQWFIWFQDKKSCFKLYTTFCSPLFCFVWWSIYQSYDSIVVWTWDRNTKMQTSNVVTLRDIWYIQELLSGWSYLGLQQLTWKITPGEVGFHMHQSGLISSIISLSRYHIWIFSIWTLVWI